MHRLCSILALSTSLACAAQQTAAPSLTTEQQALLDAARQAFGEKHPDVALAKMKQLHAMVPENQTITDGTAETALTLGDDAYAITLLKPWTATHPDDAFALESLARAYAESGEAHERDAAIAAVLKLHESSTNESFRRADRFLVERIKLPSGNLDLYQALVPFSPYHIYMLGRQTSADGALVRQITLESNDADQDFFAKEHPELAAKGERRFSMDTYSAPTPGPNGSATQTQALIGFFDGQPTFDDTKARMVKVAMGDIAPKAARSGIPVQQTSRP